MNFQMSPPRVALTRSSEPQEASRSRYSNLVSIPADSRPDYNVIGAMGSMSGS